MIDKTKVIKDVTLAIYIDGIGDRTNEICFTYSGVNIEYIDIENNKIDITELDNYSCDKDIRSDFSRVFRAEVVEYLMLNIFQLINHRIKRHSKFDDIVLIEIDINNMYKK